MNRISKWVLLTFLLSMLITEKSNATTHPAASCSSGNVQTAINQSSNGDTVTIPAGSCTWISPVNMNKNIILQGAGQGITTITDSYAGGSVLNITISGSALARVTGFTWQMGTLNPCSSSCKGDSINILGGATSFRMDHITFSGWTGNNMLALILIDNVFGVLDHLNVVMPYGIFIDIYKSSYLGIGDYGDNSWAQPDSFGTANNLFIEDSYFQGTAAHGMALQDCDGNGCRFVARHNTLQETVVQFHGTESPGRKRGGRHAEVYSNTFQNDATLGQSLGYAVQFRSGTGLVYNNTFTSVNGSVNPSYTTGVFLSEYRVADSLGGWGACDGRGAYDKNDGVVYATGAASSSGVNNVLTDGTHNWTSNQWVVNGAPYSLINVTQGWGSEIRGNTATTITTQAGAGFPGPNDTHPWSTGDTYQILRATICIDQPGRGQGILLSGNTAIPTGYPGDVLDPVYVWNNSLVGTSIIGGSIVGSNTGRIIANRDYYSQCGLGTHSDCSGAFTGAMGTGAGPLSARPASCTPVVAYWATDTNTLYKCLTTNTWTASYTPYPYPHPLTQDSGTGNTVAAPTSLTAVVQ